jgi:hypothetical protein
MDVVDFAYQIIKMQNRIETLEHENARLQRYEHDYQELLDQSIQHGSNMMRGLLEVCMTPGVMQAIGDNKSKEQTK